MSHTRQQIREAVATLLNTSATLWARAYETRIPSSRQVWPYLMVYAVNEAATAELIHSPNVYTRDLTIHVVGMLRLPCSGDTETIEDKMDAIASSVETKLTFATLKAALSGVESLVLESTSMDVVVTEEGAIDHAELTMVWRAGYSTAEGSPDTFI